MADVDRSAVGGVPDDRLRRFSASLRELASSRDADQTLQLIVDLAVEVVGGADVADVMFVRAGHVSSPVVSDGVAAELDRAQHESGEGPCLVALRNRDRVVVHDLTDDDRWPTFTPKALELGVRSVAAYRLFHDRGDEHDQYGALNLFGTEPGFAIHDLELGEVLAAHCAAILARTIDRDGVEVALLAREVIGQAKGILMVRHGLDPDLAYDMLRSTADEHGITIQVLASQIVAATSTLR